VRNRAYLYDRGGEHLLGTFGGEQVSIRWERVRDNVSEAAVTIQISDAACRSALREARTVRHELVIERDGARVWEGPIIHLTLVGTGGVVRARDALFFTQRRVCHLRHSSAFPAIESTVARTVRILNQEMGAWEAAGARLLDNIDAYDNADVARTSRVTPAYSQYVWSDMDALAERSGMDYTMNGRRLVLHDTHQFIAMGRRLTDVDFLKPLEVSEYGVELAVTNFVTDGQGTARAYTVEGDDYYGPVELLASSFDDGAASGEKVPPEELEEQAQRDARARYPSPVILRVPENAQMNPATVDEVFPYLVPGVGFPIFSDSSSRTLSAIQKLDKVSVVEDSNGESVSVSISSAPIGSELVVLQDLDEEES
jgi:hypothetical protein